MVAHFFHTSVCSLLPAAYKIEKHRNKDTLAICQTLVINLEKQEGNTHTLTHSQRERQTDETQTSVILAQDQCSFEHGL